MNLHLTVQVPRSPDLNQIVDRFHHKLEPLLFAFQPELVQLQGRLVRHTSREGVSCRLNLHLPTGQLSSEETAATAQAAFRSASDDLLRQLNKHKQRLRETRPHLRSAAKRGKELGGAGAATASSEAAAARNADLSAYFGSHYEHLLGFVRRQIALRERMGELPSGWLDPQEVLDEVVVAALAARPGSVALNRGRWFLLLAAAAIRNLVKTYGDHPHGRELRSLDQPAAPAAGETAEGDEELRLQDIVASDHADPEQTAVAKEALGRLASALAPLPRQQRHDLVLYLLEGFRPQELAQLTKRTEADVLASLEQAEAALRAQPELPTLLQHRLPMGLERGRTQERKNPRAGMLPQRA